MAIDTLLLIEDGQVLGTALVCWRAKRVQLPYVANSMALQLPLERSGLSSEPGVCFVCLISGKEDTDPIHPVFPPIIDGLCLSVRSRYFLLISHAAFGGSSSTRGNTGPFWIGSGE